MILECIKTAMREFTLHMKRSPRYVLVGRNEEAILFALGYRAGTNITSSLASGSARFGLVATILPVDRAEFLEIV